MFSDGEVKQVCDYNASWWPTSKKSASKRWLKFCIWIKVFLTLIISKDKKKYFCISIKKNDSNRIIVISNPVYFDVIINYNVFLD